MEFLDHEMLEMGQKAVAKGIVIYLREID